MGMRQDDVVAAIINFNTAALTKACAKSLLDAGISRILLLDNASAPGEVDALEAAFRAEPRVRMIRSDTNLGFAEGSNRLIDEALLDASCERVLLVNSDAAVVVAGLHACLDAMRAGGYDLMGARMMKPDGTTVDSLGMSLYKSLLASNRKSVQDVYLGPTGGFAVYGRRFLEELRGLHGYVFDPAYFCYAEDTDVCVRARLLDSKVGYVDDTAAYHEGQASNAGAHDDFILYHGIRNSIWMLAKTMPGWIVLSHLPWIVLLHGGIVVRHVLQGRWRTVWRLYRDALAGLPRVMRQRRVVQSTRRASLPRFRTCIDAQFYETRFLKGAVRDLFRR